MGLYEGLIQLVQTGQRAADASGGISCRGLRRGAGGFLRQGLRLVSPG